MKPQETIDYQRISDAIEYLSKNFRTQPSLEEVAEHVNLSPYHFQRLFTSWAGISPKKFTQFLTVQYAKRQLQQEKTLFDTALNTGLSGTGRLHDLFISIEAMTPGEFKKQGRGLLINYSFENTPFGEVLIASTAKGICYMAFVEGKQEGFGDLRKRFPLASLNEVEKSTWHAGVSRIWSEPLSTKSKLSLYVAGSPFQLKVWEALLSIPLGELSTYGAIAKQIGNPNASRAVGTAIGQNPIAYLIPCHRVIRSTGEVGGYMWGPNRKTSMIGWEAAQRSLGQQRSL